MASRRSLWCSMTLAGSEDQSDSTGHYEALSESAVSFIEWRGGSVHEDALVLHVFGRSTSPALWRSLLQRALAEEPRLTYTADGHWMLAAGARTAPLVEESLLPRFVALDVETTGLKATSHRIIEVALIRHENGIEVDRFDRLVNPGRTIPAYISKLTGIRNDDVADAAVFGTLVDDIVTFIGEDPVIGHNVAFDIGFLNAELSRVHIGRVVNETIDTLTLATRLIPGLRRPSLDRVARAVGITPRKIHRAGTDAAMAAEIALRLEAEARRQGIASFDALKALSSANEPGRRNKVGRGRTLTDRSLLDGIPQAPGVYIMRDADGQVIYVGKAKNLRDRVRTYFSQPMGYARKMDGLVEAIARIDTEVVGSELEALLLEAQLIRRYTPRYNTMMRAFEHYPYIRVDVGNRWPRVTLVKDLKDDGARYFGPYRSKSAARKTVDVINDVLPLRTCTRSFKDARSYGNPCIRLALGKCMGPCVDVSIRGDYLETVHQIIRFLDGDDDALYHVLWGALEEAAERQDFDRAEKLRRNLATVNSIVNGQRGLRQAVECHHLVLVVPSVNEGERELWLVLEGRIWSRTSVGPPVRDDAVLSHAPQRDGGGEAEDRVLPEISDVSREQSIPTDEVVERLAVSYRRAQASGVPPISHDSLDDIHILNRWIAAHSDHPAVLVLDRDRVDDGAYWREMVERALGVPDEHLVLEVTGGAPEASEGAAATGQGRGSAPA
ncbi:MAG TPA: exonuclease domain-containing protein [Thermomicrobiales bacterium]|nr:exonuclease domain-containing protein [Thermomicrobiales bacterium]